MIRFALLAPLLLLVAACGPATGGDYLTDGTYQGTDRNGAEYTLKKQGNQVELNGAPTEPDDNRRDTAFVAKFSPGKPRWECRPKEHGNAAACTLQLRTLASPLPAASPAASSTGLIRIDLMKENE
ncbi:MAG: hypothetical protein NVS3B24_06600 [Candidatus Dormibacteria bacterium]